MSQPRSWACSCPGRSSRDRGFRSLGLPMPGTQPAVVTLPAERPDVLLATKLHVPGIHPGFVPRSRLVQALSEGLARGRVLVCAPAGFGKTTLLADWARGDGRPVAWLSLDAGDNDPARFWRHAVAALDVARPGVDERVGPLLSPPPRSFEGAVTAVINEFATPPGTDEVLFVLDDYHQVSSEPVHASVAFLLENLPPGLHLVLTSRTDPPLPLAGPRPTGRAAGRRAAVHRHGSGGAAGPDGRAPPAGGSGGGAGGPHRRVGGGAATGRAVAARAVRCGRVRGRVHRQPPLRAGLPDRRGTGKPERAGARVPAGNLGAGPAVGATM